MCPPSRMLPWNQCSPEPAFLKVVGLDVDGGHAQRSKACVSSPRTWFLKSSASAVMLLQSGPVCERQACLKEHGVCPFTKAPLSWEQCTVLTVHNIERFRARIK